MIRCMKGGEAHCDVLESEGNDDAYGLICQVNPRFLSVAAAGPQSLEFAVAVESDMMKLRSG